MNSLTVIIPSKNIANLAVSADAVWLHEPSARILAIDDGLDYGMDPDYNCSVSRHVNMFLSGAKPFVYARNCNLGINTAAGEDIVLLNDDAVLETPRGLTRMQEFANSRPDIGLISATTDHAGNPAQHRRPGLDARVLIGKTPGNSFPTVAFVCVLIPRRTIELVGLLDERFTAYGWEDNDYCRRLFIAGRKIAVHDGCFVSHSKLTPTFRSGPALAGSIAEGKRIYLEKWGTV